MSNQVPTPDQSPVSHSKRDRLMASGALVGTLAAGAAGIAFGPDLVKEHDHLPGPTPVTQTAPDMHDPPTFQQHLERHALAASGHIKHVRAHGAEPAVDQAPNDPPPKVSTPTNHSAPKPKHKPERKKQLVAIESDRTANAPVLPIIDIPVEKLPKPAELKNLHPEKVPAEVSKVMAENTVYINGLGCSGFKIKNPAGETVGISTAQHCSLLAKNGHWGNDGQGNTILNFNAPLSAMTGDVMGQLTSVGNIKEVALNAPDDMGHDEAVAAFEGHTAEEALSSLNQMSAEEIANLQTGDVIYNSGWPVDQKNNKGPLKRQEFAMSVLGTVTWRVTNGETLNLLLTGVPESADGAECSWGDSGSAGFVLGEDGQPRIVGTLSAFNDFGALYNKDRPEDAAAEREYIQNLFGVDMTGFAGVCGFSYEPPSIENGAVFAKVVTPEAVPTLDIVGDIERAKEAFRDPNYDKNIAEGLLAKYVSPRSETPDAVIENPFIYLSENDGVIVVLSSQTKDGEPIADVLTNPGDLILYSNKEDGSLPIHHSKGDITIGPDGEFIDNEGFIFGKSVDPSTWPLKPGPRYTLEVDKLGNVRTVPYTEPQGPMR